MSQIYQLERLNVIYVPFILFNVFGIGIPFNSILNFVIGL